MKVHELFDNLNYSGHFICYSACDGRILFRTFGKKYKKYLYKEIERLWVSIETDNSKYSDKSVAFATLCFYVTPLEEDLPKRLQNLR